MSSFLRNWQKTIGRVNKLALQWSVSSALSQTIAPNFSFTQAFEYIAGRYFSLKSGGDGDDNIAFI